MNKLILILTATALLVACGKDETETKSVANAEEAKSSQPDILQYIPADTPLLITSGLNPDQYPKRYVEVMQKNMDSVVEYLEVVLDKAMNEESKNYVTTVDANGEEVISEEVDAEEAAMKEKVRGFMNRWFDKDAMNTLGFKMGETQMAMYMVDLFPVVRMKLSSDNQVNALFDDIEKEFEVPFTKSEVNGQQVREIQNDKATFIISIDNDYLVLGISPTVIKDQMINQLLGSEKPAQSLANNPALINDVKSKHGYVIDDILLLDIKTIADHFIYPSKYNSPMVNFMQIDDNMLSAVCKDEISALVANAPRMVAGSKAMTDNTVNASFVWEMDSKIASDMATMAGRIPKGNPGAAMSFGMSFDLLAAKNLASKYVDEAIADPYKCELFAQFQTQLTDMQAKLSQPIPPFVGNFKGINFSLDDLKLNMAAANLENPNPKDVIESFKSQIYLAVDETQALLGMAQMMVPQLQGLDIKTDGSLITLADHVPLISGKDIPIDVANLYAAVSEDTIGFSIGHLEGGTLAEKVKQEGESALMSMSLNVDGYKDLMEQIFKIAEMPDMPESIKQELEMQKELSMSMLYWKTQDMSMLFTDQGFTTNIDYTY